MTQNRLSLLLLLLLLSTVASAFATLEMSVDAVYQPADKKKFPDDDTPYSIRYVVFYIYVKNNGSDVVRMPRYINDHIEQAGGDGPDKFRFGLVDTANSRGMPVKMTDAEMKVVELGKDETCLIQWSDCLSVKKDGTPPVVELKVSEKMGAKYNIWSGTLKAVAVVNSWQ